MPLERRFRIALYAVVATLFATGAAWLAIDAIRDPLAEGPGGRVASTLLMIHGAAAMALLILFGALFALHIQPAWRCRKNRISGGIAVGLNAVLIITAFGLYYIGSEMLRAWISDLHIGLGLGLPLLLGAHVVCGRHAAARHRTARFRATGETRVKVAKGVR